MLPSGIARKYQTKRLLGEGAFGAVWQAIDLATGKQVALKIVSKEVLESKESKGRFTHEAQVVSQVRHAAILPVLEFGFESGVGYIVFPFVSGTSLRDRIDQGPLETSEALLIAIGLAEALTELHRHGIVHRDLKPENVLIAESKQPMLMDFGFAKSSASEVETGRGIIVGTPAYVSPEQLQESRAGPASDQFSLGVLLFEMLTGRRPYSGISSADEAVARVHEPAIPIRSLLPELDSKAAQAVMRMLEREPDRRFANLGEVRRKLQVAAQRVQSMQMRSRTPASGTTPSRPGWSISGATSSPREKLRSGLVPIIRTSRARIIPSTRLAARSASSRTIKMVRSRAQRVVPRPKLHWWVFAVFCAVLAVGLVAWLKGR